MCPQNSGYDQGCLLKRCKVPNPGRLDRTWHWSELNVGDEPSFHGVVYRLCGCDPSTRRFLSTQGVQVGPDEPVPDDPYTIDRRQKRRPPARSGGRSTERKLRQFLEYDGKMLRCLACAFSVFTARPHPHFTPHPLPCPRERRLPVLPSVPGTSTISFRTKAPCRVDCGRQLQRDNVITAFF